MEMLSVVGLGLTAAALAVVLRQYKPEYALLVTLGAGVLIFLWITGEAEPLLRQIERVITLAKLPGEYAQVLLKSLGICFLTQLGCDTCRDAGESAVAAKVELAGRVAVLVLSMPLYQKILEVAGSLFSL